MAIVSASIKSNITRIANAKTNIISAIKTKGGTVASGAKIEDLPACISAIPTGGGGEAASLKIAYSSDFAAEIVYPGGHVTAADDMENIDCEVGDLISVVTGSNSVTVEFGVEATYYIVAGSGAARRYIYYFTITEPDAVINIS